MNLRTHVLELPFRDPFRIARDEPDEKATTVIVELEGGGTVGLGESHPVAYYRESVGSVTALLPRLLDALPEGLATTDPEEARTWLEAAAEAARDAVPGGGEAAARCGLDVALHDLLARELDVPLHELLGIGPETRPTDFSIGIDAPDVVAARAARAAHFPALKIKLGGAADVPTLEAVREVYAGPLRVDANTGWEREAAATILPELERLGVELIEQPFPAHDLEALRWLQSRSRLPIVADESAVTIDDLPRLVGVVTAVNVKLQKAGGVGPALRMIRRARELGFAVMLGCMVETSVGIAASAVLSGLVDWVDLDGNLLLAEDPFEGLTLADDARWVLGAPGLGVRRTAGGPRPEAS